MCDLGVFFFVVLSKLLIKVAWTSSFQECFQAYMVANYLKRLPVVQVPCVNLFGQVDCNTSVQLPCSTRSEIIRKRAAFLLQDSDSSLARNSNSFHPVRMSLTRQRRRQTWCSEDKMYIWLALKLYLFLLSLPQNLAWGHPGVIPKQYSPEPCTPG